MSWKGCSFCHTLHGTDQYCPAPHPFSCKEWYALTPEERAEIIALDG